VRRLQTNLPASRVVKAFNHIYAAQLTTDGLPAGTKNRRALVIAGNDGEAKATVARLLDQFGFDTVDAGLLMRGGASSATLRGMDRVARRRNCAGTLLMGVDKSSPESRVPSPEHSSRRKRSHVLA
jgi:predicted dinucleotide-binding enzyme